MCDLFSLFLLLDSQEPPEEDIYLHFESKRYLPNAYID